MKYNKFSVLMSVYYKEKPDFFDASLDSIFKQTLIPNEVILMEDGKLTNDLDRVVNKYLIKYPKILKVIKNKDNRGLGLSLHDGLLNCSNEIVFRMDTDDYSVKDRFKKTMDCFNSRNVDLIGSNIIEYNQKMDTKIGCRIVPELNDNIVKAMKKKNPFNHMTVAFKKSKVLEAGNYLNMQYFEDYYLWVRMYLNKCTFYNIQEYLVKVRGGDEMIDRRGGKKYIKPIISFQKKLLELKVINVFEFLFNVFSRVLLSIFPKSIRKKIYLLFLREKGDNNETAS